MGIDSTSSVVLHNSDMVVIQTSCLCRAKQIHTVYMYFGGIAFARGVTRRPREEFSFTEYAHWMLPEAISEVKTRPRCKLRWMQQTINLKVALYTRNVFFSFYKCSNHPYLYRGSRRQDWTAKEFSEENKIVVRKQSCNNSTRLACKGWSIFCRLPFLLLLKSCNN